MKLFGSMEEAVTNLPKYAPRSDTEMREFYKGLGMDPEVINRAIEMRLQNPTGDDLIDVQAKKSALRK